MVDLVQGAINLAAVHGRMDAKLSLPRPTTVARNVSASADEGRLELKQGVATQWSGRVAVLVTRKGQPPYWIWPAIKAESTLTQSAELIPNSIVHEKHPGQWPRVSATSCYRHFFKKMRPFDSYKDIAKACREAATAELRHTLLGEVNVKELHTCERQPR